MKSFRVIFMPLLLAFAARAIAQPSLTVAPAYHFLDTKTPYGFINVENTGTEPLEVSVEVGPGIIGVADTATTNSILSGTTGELGDLSPHITFFPNRIVLEPGQRQAVRFMIKNRGVLPPGGYATMFRFFMGERPSPAALASDNLSLAIKFRYYLLVPVVYVSGSGSIDISARVVKRLPDKTLVLFDVSGGFPFIGHVRFVTAEGNTIGETDVSVFDRRIVEIGPLPDNTPKLVAILEAIYGDKPSELMSNIEFPKQIDVELQ